MGECFSSKPPKDFSFHALLLLGGGTEGEAGGGEEECAVGSWVERGGRLTSCQTWVLTRKLNKAAALPVADDGCYSLTTRLVMMMMAVINQELTDTQPGRGSQRGRSAPRWERQDSAHFLSDTKTDAASSLFTRVLLSAFVTG